MCIRVEIYGVLILFPATPNSGLRASIVIDVLPPATAYQQPFWPWNVELMPTMAGPIISPLYTAGPVLKRHIIFPSFSTLSPVSDESTESVPSPLRLIDAWL